MSKKFKLQLFAGILITAVIGYFSIKVIRDLHMSVVFHQAVKWGYVATAVAVYMYSNYVRGLAYTRGIDPGMGRLNALEIVTLGHSFNMVLPLHAGEGLRMAFFPSSYSVSKRTKLLLLPAMADIIVVIFISAITVPFAHFTDRALVKAMWILLYCCIGLMLVAAVLILTIPRIRSYVDEFLNVSLLKMLLWVTLSWLVILVAFWLGLIAFGFNKVESIQMALCVFVATNIINLIPASPGGIGLFEYGTVIGLGGLGVEKSVALSASLLLHLIQYMALLPMGVVLYITALRGKYGDAVKNTWKKDKTNIAP